MRYKPVKIGNAFSCNYIEYKCNGGKDKTLSIKDYFDKITPYLSDTKLKVNEKLT